MANIFWPPWATYVLASQHNYYLHLFAMVSYTGTRIVAVNYGLKHFHFQFICRSITDIYLLVYPDYNLFDTKETYYCASWPSRMETAPLWSACLYILGAQTCCCRTWLVKVSATSLVTLCLQRWRVTPHGQHGYVPCSCFCSFPGFLYLFPNVFETFSGRLSLLDFYHK